MTALPTSDGLFWLDLIDGSTLYVAGTRKETRISIHIGIHTTSPS